MRKPNLDMKIFKDRRKSVGEKSENSAFILCSHPHYIRNNDVNHDYRQDSNLFYLTGFEEPEAIFVFRPGKKPETTMFVLPKDPMRETWDGFRYGPQGLKDEFHMDDAYEIDQFEKMAPDLLMDVDKVYYRMFFDNETDQQIKRVLESVKSMRGRSGLGLTPIEDPYKILGEMRLFKSNYDLECMRKAADASNHAHLEVMKRIKPGVNERTLHGVFIQKIMEHGCAREAYGGIFASGNNATTLHYTFNDQACEDGDLFLIDAGGEYEYYASDITRTYPVNGKFNDDQKRVYQQVLNLQKDVIDMAKPGTSMGSLQKHATNFLVDLLMDEGVLKGNKQKIIDDREYAKYYPHGIGHWLGMDVHDAGVAFIRGESRVLEEGMCFTIEPGIYLPAHDKAVPKNLKGLGIRIEDNVVMTSDGCENITAQTPKEVEELESIVGSAY